MPTIADVAKLAGVSTGTVSRVINGAENVNPETRTKVKQAITMLDYKPNFQARSLRSKRTDTIALALPELSNYFWTTIARGVQDASQAAGYHVLICNTTGHPSAYLHYLEQMVNRVDGLILSRRSERALATSEQGQSAKPIVFVGQSQAAHWNVDNVYSDSISGAFALTQHLIRLGHRKIAMITGRQSSASASDRAAGYCMALADALIPLDPRQICWGEYDRKTAERLTDDLMEHLPDTTGIVAANNEIAIGVIQALERRRLPVPEAVAVVCFDDFYPDSRFATMMTVASQSPYDLGLNAAQLLLNRLNSHEHLRPQTIVLPLRLIVRQSSGSEPSLVDAETSYDNVQGQLIPSLPRAKVIALASEVSSTIQVALPPASDGHLIQTNKRQIASVRQALRGESGTSTAIPHFEYAITGRALYRYVLERDPEIEFFGQTTLIVPEDQVEFAQRSGIVAIPCRFPYRPTLAHLDDDQVSFEFPLLTDQIDFFDRYVRATRGTSVGIAADFRGIVADSLSILQAFSDGDAKMQSSLLERIADELVGYNRKVVQLICDRFAPDLAFVVFSDDLAEANGPRLPLDIFQTVFASRIRRLIHPAQEHGLSTVLYTPGILESIIPLIQPMGFTGVYVAEAEQNDFAVLKQIAQGKLSFMGGIPHASLTNGFSPEAISTLIAQLGAGGGYTAGLSGEVDDHISAENFFSLVNALNSPTI